MQKYPSIEKPQYKYYRKTPVRDIKVEQSMYDLVFETNKNNLDWPAIEYIKKTWTFRELKTATDKLADAFVKDGINQGEVVLIGLVNCVEAYIALLALNKVGAISKWIDLRASVEDVKEYIEENNCRYVVSFVEALPLFVYNENYLKRIISVGPMELQSAATKAAFALKETFGANKNGPGSAPAPDYPDVDVNACTKIIPFRKFMETGDPNSDIKQLPFDRNRPSIIIQSSGTTGKAKSIVHSDISATSSTRSLMYCDLKFEPHKRVLALLPPWIAYGLGQSILYPLAAGCTVLVEPDLFKGIEKVIKHLGKYTACIGVPQHFRYVIWNFNSLTEKQKEQLYNVDFFVSGGDKISPDENENFDKTFKTPVVNGYGNNESWGCLTVNCAEYNRYGSVGIPKYGETIISYNNEEERELPFGELGEICVCSDTMFLYYEGDEQKTAETKKVHADGKVWLHTGDIGYIDEDGFVYLKGRIRRVIVRASFKISAYTIEDTITSLSMVRECVAVQVKDEAEIHVPMAFVVVNESDKGNEEAIRRIINAKCIKELKSFEIPKYIKFVDSLPITPNKKYNFTELERLGDEYVDSLSAK